DRHAERLFEPRNEDERRDPPGVATGARSDRDDAVDDSRNGLPSMREPDDVVKDEATAIVRALRKGGRVSVAREQNGHFEFETEREIGLDALGRRQPDRDVDAERAIRPRADPGEIFAESFGGPRVE